MGWELITPDSLADLDSAQNTKLVGVEAGATDGATWGSNVGGRPTELTDGRVGTGLNNSGVIQTTVPVARGGTSQTSTDTFLNNEIGISTTGSSITINRGSTYGSTAISNLGQGLVGLSGVANNADQTSSNTSYDTARVNTTSAATVSSGAGRANAAIDSSNRVTGSLYDGTNTRTPANINDSYVRATTGLTSGTGAVKVAVPTGYGGTGETATNRFLNNQIAISQGNNGVLTIDRGGYASDTTTITKSNLGLSYSDGATVGATVGTNFYKSGTTTNYNTNEFQNADLSVSAGSNGILTLNRGVSNTTTTITKSNLGLSYSDGATVGATIGTNMFKDNGSTLATNNELLNTNTNWADVVGTTDAPASNATVGATWGSNLGGRPTELTDGRIGTGLDSSGRVTSGIVSGGTLFSASEVVSTRGCWDSIGTTPVLKTNSANSALKNATITINASTGQIENIGTSNIVVNNQKVTVVNGVLTGIGTSNIVVDNSQSVTSSINSGNTSHNWTFFSGTEYSPSGLTQTVVIDWRSGTGVLLAQCTIVSTLDDDDQNINITRTSNSGSVSFSGSGGATDQITSTTKCTYEDISVTVYHNITDISGWDFK